MTWNMSSKVYFHGLGGGGGGGDDDDDDDSDDNDVLLSLFDSTGVPTAAPFCSFVLRVGMYQRRLSPFLLRGTAISPFGSSQPKGNVSVKRSRFSEFILGGNAQ